MASFYKIILIIEIIIIGLGGGLAARFIKETEKNVIFINPYKTEKTITTTTTTGIGAEIIDDSYQNRNLKPLFWDLRDGLRADKKDFIEANLTEMKIKFYQKGEVLKEYPIIAKGEEGKWGETPSGLFKIKHRQKNHFSSLGQVFMPWNLIFQGNYSIHGWPYYPDGTLISRLFSSGCINLSTNDAKELFNLSDVDMPVLVLKENFKNNDFNYVLPSKPSQILLRKIWEGKMFPKPEISAKAYLAADLQNGFVFLEKNANLILPVASLTKLMTALVASEYSLLSPNQEMAALIKITPAMIAPIGENQNIKVGKKFSYLELFYPMLITSSNDAAESLAISQDKKSFIKFMNERARSLEMNNTYFADAYGLDENNVSTAEDLFYLAKYLLNNRQWILDITKGKIFNDFGPISFKNLKNLNLFYDDPDFIGGKVGETPIAKKTGVFLFNLRLGEEKRPIAIIVLGSDDNKEDAEAILKWIKSNFATPF